MAATTFLIGDNASANPDDWSVVSTLLSSVSNDITVDRAMQWSHQDYSQYEKLGNMDSRGYGFPVVVWRFKALKEEQRENLRDFIPDVSAQVYIRTPTNETVAGVRVWKDYLCYGKWTQRAEIIDAGLENVRQFEITFEHCEDVT
jgi:hypothetical protein